MIRDLLFAAAGASAGGGGGQFPVPGANKLRNRVAYKGPVASTFNVVNPACVVGDLLVFIANFSTNGLMNTPAGWTRVSSSTSSVRMQVFTKIADSVDAAGTTYTWTFTNGGVIAYNLFTFTQSGTVVGQAGTPNSTAASISSPSLSVATTDNIVLGIFTDPSNITISLSGAIPISALANGAAVPSLAVGYAEQAASGVVAQQTGDAVPNYTNGTSYTLVIGAN